MHRQRLRVRRAGGEELDAGGRVLPQDRLELRRYAAAVDAAIGEHAAAQHRLALAQGEVGLGAEQRERMLDAFAVALLVAREHRVGGFDVTGADHVVEAHAQRRELFDVAFKEVGPLPIHALEEFVHDPGREGIVDADAAVVRVLQQRPDLARDHPLAIARRDRPGRQRRGAGGQAGGSPGDRDERDEGDGADEQGGTGRIGHAVLHSGRLGTD